MGVPGKHVYGKPYQRFESSRLRFMPSPLDDIKSRLDLIELVQSYIRLQKAGVNWRALCPFHSEKTPSFVVSPARQIWHCFGCGKGGTHIDFVMEIEGLEFRDALELLAGRAGIQLRREDPKLRSERTRLYQIVEDAARIFESTLHSARDPSVRVSPQLVYLKKRGLADETIKSFRLGYAPDSWDFLTQALQQKGYGISEIEKAGLAVKSEQGSHYDRFRQRIIFPISDASGRVVGFSGRIFDVVQRSDQRTYQRESASMSPQEPAKYINTPQTLIYDKSRILYGFDKAKEEIRKQNAVILVEGQMDVVLSHQAGVKNAVAVSGTALASQQLQTLKRLASTIISSFDRDAAGEMATKRSLDLAAAHDFERKVAILPAAFKDPAEAVAENPELWREAVSKAKPIVQFFLETALAKNDLKSASGKRTTAASVLPEIKILSSEVEKAHWIQTLGRAIGVEEEALWRELKKSKPASVDAFYPQKSESKAAPDRRSQLESLLLGTLILHPEERSRLPEVMPHLFLSDKHLKILEIIERALTENVREHNALLSAIPAEFQETCNYLAFQAEVVLERIESASERAREILVLMHELELAWAREKLRGLSVEIAEAETHGDKRKLAMLLDEFRIISAKVQ